MKIAYLGSGESLPALAARVYGLPAGTPDAKLREAADLLSKTNPQLSSIDSLPKGTPVVVPEGPTLAPSTDAKPATGRWGSALDALDRLLADYEQKLSDIDDDESSHAKTTVKLAGTPEIKAALAVKDLTSRIQPILDAARARLDGAAQIRKERQAVVAAIRADLESLRAQQGG